MNLEVRCLKCDKEESRMKKQVMYLSTTLEKHKCNQKERKPLYNNLNRTRRKLKHFQQKKAMNATVNAAPPIFKSVNKSDAVNVRAMMAVYYGGVGLRDIGNTMSFIGVPGGGP